MKKWSNFTENEQNIFMDDFRAQCRRQLKQNLDSRIKDGFFRNYTPIEDDEPVRYFEKMSDYRKWADENLPRYLGYKIAVSDDEK